jgi:hypothetical protein
MLGPKLVVVVGAVSLGGFVLACSSSSATGSGDGPGSVSSVDSSKPASSLSEGEATQYCKDQQRYWAAQYAKVDSQKIMCGYYAEAIGVIGTTTDDDAKAACRSQLADCLAKPNAEDPSDGGDSEQSTETYCATEKDVLKGCDATVAELNACDADSAAAFKALEGKDFCADATARADISATAQPMYELPASCKALYEKCPGMAGGSSGAPSGT